MKRLVALHYESCNTLHCNYLLLLMVNELQKPLEFSAFNLNWRVANNLFKHFFQSRFDILKIHSRKMNLMRGIDLKKIAEKMGGASGAELKVGWIFIYVN